MKFNFKKTSEILAESGATDEQMDYETPEPGIEDLDYNEDTGEYDYPPGDLMLDAIQRHIADGTDGYPQTGSDNRCGRELAGEAQCLSTPDNLHFNSKEGNA